MTRSLFALFALGALVGCKSTEVKLGVDIAPLGTASSALAAADVATLPSHSSVTAVSRVRLLVNEAKLQGAPPADAASSDAAAPADKGHHDCRGSHDRGSDDAVVAGPFIIDLTSDEIANGAHRDFSVTAPASAVFGNAEIEIEPLDTRESGGDTSGAEFDDFRTSGASLIVDGTFKEQAFQFVGHFKAEQGTNGTFDIASGASIAINMTVNPASWFVDAEGNDLDPIDPAQHSAVAVAICKLLDTEQEARGHHGKGAHCME